MSEKITKVSVLQQKSILKELRESGMSEKQVEDFRLSMVEKNLWSGITRDGKRLEFEGTDYTVYAHSTSKVCTVDSAKANKTVTPELDMFLELQKEIYGIAYSLLLEAKGEGIIKNIADNRSFAKADLLGKIKVEAYQRFINKIEEKK
tara:strand:+ start:431 stop:874 length:444 start_codon:yes stop_codon:yes gene_type:complete